MDPWKGVKWFLVLMISIVVLFLGALSNVLGFSLTGAQSVGREGLAFDAILH